MYTTSHKSKLTEILCSHYILYIKIQNFHWNVEGKAFFSVHKKLEEQYEIFAAQNDELAERIRMLGQKSPGSAEAFLKQSFIKEADSKTDSEKIVSILRDDYVLLRDKCLECATEAGDNGDEATVDLLNERVGQLEKEIWMFDAYLT